MPSPRRTQLRWIGWGLLAVWSLATAALGAYAFVNASANSSLPGVSVHGSFQAGAALWLLLIFIWVASLNIGSAGLIITIIAIVRRRTGWLWRLPALFVITILGAVVELWGLFSGNSDPLPSSAYQRHIQVHSGLVVAAAVVVTVGTALLLGLGRSEKPAAIPSR